jgi:hypothetical protein
VTCGKMCKIPFEMSLSTDCCDRQAVWPRVLLAVFRSRAGTIQMISSR